MTFKTGICHHHHHHHHHHRHRHRHRHRHHHHHHHHHQLSARNYQSMMKDYSPNTNPSTVHIPKPRLNTSLRYSGDTSRGQEHKSNNNPYACSSQGHGLSWGLQCRITDWSAAHMEKNMERTHNQVNQVVIQVNTTYTCHTCPPMGVLFIKLHFGVAGAPGKWRYMAMPACLQTGSMI